MKPPVRIACLLLPAVVCGLLLLWSIPSLLIAKKVIGLLTEHYALRRYAEELERRRREVSGE